MRRPGTAQYLVVMMALSVTIGATAPVGWAASQQMKPALKAIDPSQVKMDPGDGSGGTDTTPAPSPEPVAKPPLGKINGAPLSKKGAAAMPPPPSPAPAEPATTVDGSGASAYTPDNNGYGTYGDAPDNSGASSGPAASYGSAPYSGAPSTPGSYGTGKPAGGRPPTSKLPMPPGGTKAGGKPTSRPAATAAGNPAGGGLSSMIPEFGQPLPAAQGGAPSSGAGWSTNQYAPAGGGGSSAAPGQLESRIVRLEQQAFGSTYPEHEIEDRVDHLEQEVLGKKSTDPLDQRVARIESKLGIQATSFGGPPPQQRTQKPPAITQPVSKPPVVASRPPETSNPMGSGGGFPAQGGGFPAQGGGFPAQGGGFPAQGGTYQTQGGYPQQGGYPAQQPSAKPPARPATSAKPAAKPKLPAGIAVPQAPPQVVPGSGPAEEAPLRDFAANVDLDNFYDVVGKMPFDFAKGEYFSQVRKFEGNYARWASFPIKVHLPQGSPPNWNLVLQKSVKRWGQYIPIKEVPPAQAADIEVAWINRLPPKQLGLTNLEIFNGRMRVTIYLLRPNLYPQGVSDQMLGEVVLHQLGHSLGIFGHSTFPTDAMTPLPEGTNRAKANGITVHDVNTLKKIYESNGLPDGYQSGQPVVFP
ncbi:MAG: hypothetical protein U0105_26500 [Candidatus Obscuribacterales bacterium]